MNSVPCYTCHEAGEVTDKRLEEWQKRFGYDYTPPIKENGLFCCPTCSGFKFLTTEIPTDF